MDWLLWSVPLVLAIVVKWILDPLLDRLSKPLVDFHTKPYSGDEVLGLGAKIKPLERGLDERKGGPHD